jgi:hypothetical protein
MSNCSASLVSVGVLGRGLPIFLDPQPHRFAVERPLEAKCPRKRAAALGEV